MYKIVYTNRMKHDAKLMKKRGKNMDKLVSVLSMLASGSPLPKQYRDHQLTGNLQDFRECHTFMIYQPSIRRRMVSGLVSAALEIFMVKTQRILGRIT